MISVGEESGQVDVLLAEVAAFYESEVEYDVKQLSDRIEPIMIVIMAGFVTVLALGIFLPMWDMYAIQK
jgi:MSHA biogenesis protein MshG